MASRSSVHCAAESQTDGDFESKSETKKVQLQGGYECIFVEEPPKHLQTECSVCLCILREPCMLDCCGNRFCRTCIDPILSQHQPCPLCSLPFTTSVQDKQLQRTLSSLQVYCSHKEVGCDWMGELGCLPQHLNIDCEDEVSLRLNGCLFARLQCVHCKKPIQRQDITKHEGEQCLERPYSCDYCHNYSSTCKDVVDNHWPICPCRSIPCPNECGIYPLRKDIKTHQADECPLAVIECSFSYAGCDVKVLCQDMSGHIAESLGNHMSLQAISHQKKLEEVQVEIKQLKVENQKLKEQLEEQNLKIFEVQRTLRHIVRHQEAAAMENPEATATPKSNIAPVLIVFKDFQQHTIWWSPPFYTHCQGYKMCIKVFPNGNCLGENTHVSVYINVMKGEFDDQLPWPFRGNFKIRLLRNNSESSYFEKVVHFTDRIHPRVSGRVIKGDKLIQGYGVDQFILQDALSSGYIHDNSLRFRVLCTVSWPLTWKLI